MGGAGSRQAPARANRRPSRGLKRLIEAKKSGLSTWLLSLLTAIAAWAPSLAFAQNTAPLPEPLGLEQVLQFAREHRAEILAARARARAFAERGAIVSALDDPMVSPSVNHLPFMLNGVNVSLTVEQRFPLSGVLGNRRRAAEAAARGADAEANKVELDVELDAASAFLMLQERRAMLHIFEEQRSLAAQFVRAATARYASGTGNQADSLRAEIEVLRLDAALKTVAAEARASEVMLNTSLGRSPLDGLPPLDNSVSVGPPPTTDVVRRTALDSRPELRVGNAEIAKANAELDVMHSMYAPMAMVRTGPAYTMTEGPGWMLMVGISIPLWRGKLTAGVNEATAMSEMARADLVAMRRMVEGESLSAREQVIGAQERFVALRDLIIPRARRAVEPTLTGYSTGQLPLVSVIEAAQTLWLAQGELVAAQFELGLAWARLHRAMGETGGPR